MDEYGSTVVTGYGGGVVGGAARLGIDFGTSTTIAVISLEGREPRPLLFDGSPLLPSAVCVDPTGRLLVGRDALHLSIAAPGSFEPYPKRCVDDGTVLLGGTDVAVGTLFGAVLGRVVDEATRLAGGPPTEVALTHPAAWGSERRAVLERVAPPGARLVPEPVAAAHYFVDIAGHQVPEGGIALVYDFGAGTFDASLVRRTVTGFEVVASKGLSDAGGLDIDAAIVDHLRSVTAGDELWARLTTPVELTDRRARQQLWDNVRTAKEMLSRSTTTLIHVPLFDADVPLGREEFEQLAAPILDVTVAACRELLAGAEVRASELSAIFLAGGSSRMPAVATSLHRSLGIAPSMVDQPELVVAEGSLRAAGGGSALADEASWPALSPVAVPDAPAGRRRLAVVAAAVVVALLLAGAAAAYALTRDAPDDRRAGVGASPTPSPSTTYPPGIDPCLLGVWETVTVQRYAPIDGVDVQYTGGAGGQTEYRIDGTVHHNFNFSQPVVADYKGARWEMTNRGVASASYHTDGKVIRISAVNATGTVTLTRNGRYNNGITLSLLLDPTTYVCRDDRLDTFNDNGQYTAVARRIAGPPSPTPSAAPAGSG